MVEEFVRKPSGIEAFFVDLDAGGCNMTFHFYLELDKEPDVELLNATMRKMLETHKSINMKLYRNLWYSSSYIPECRIIDVDCEDVTAYKACHLDFRRNTVALNVLHVIKKNAWYLRFDFFHGVFDGLSGIQFVYNFFDVLNGKDLPELDFTSHNYYLEEDVEAADGNGERQAFTVLPKCEPAGWNTAKQGSSVTAIISCERPIRCAAARFSEIIGSYFSGKSAKVIVPVNVRKYLRKINTAKEMFGNLFVPMLVDVKLCKSWSHLHSKIIDFVKHKSRLKRVAEKLKIYRRFPAKLRQAVIRWAIPIVMSSKKFIYCALVSSLGKIDHERLTSKSFNIKDYLVTFDSFPFTAFSVITLQFKNKTNTSVSWHSGRVSANIAQSLVNDIARSFEIPMLLEQM